MGSHRQRSFFTFTMTAAPPSLAPTSVMQLVLIVTAVMLGIAQAGSISRISADVDTNFTYANDDKRWMKEKKDDSNAIVSDQSSVPVDAAGSTDSGKAPGLPSTFGIETHEDTNETANNASGQYLIFNLGSSSSNFV